VIHEKSKEFKSHGNIFKDKEMLAMIPELVTDDVWKTVTSEEEDHLVITDSIVTDLGPNKCVITANAPHLFCWLNIQSETQNYDFSSRATEFSLCCIDQDLSTSHNQSILPSSVKLKN
jgi:hypothetical protein